MAGDRLHSSGTLVKRLQWAAAGLVVIGVAALAAAIVVPVDVSAEDSGMAVASRGLEPLHEQPVDVRALMNRMGGTVLIRPAQVRAAVMDRGLAKKLLARLKLQGVVQTGEGYTAYVRVEKEGVQSVREGGSLLEFAVEKVEPGRVTLSLEGVTVELVP